VIQRDLHLKGSAATQSSRNWAVVEPVVTLCCPHDDAMKKILSAVAAAVQGLATHMVTIEQGEDYLGVHSGPNPVFGYDDNDRAARQRRVRAAIVGCYAGLAAEHVILGERFPLGKNPPPFGAADDFARAWDLVLSLSVRGASFVGDDAYDRVDGRLRRQALKLMVHHRMTVERLANALFEAGTLSGDGVEAIVRGTSPAGRGEPLG